MLQLRLDLSAIAICLQKKLSSLGYRDFLILCITEYRTGFPPPLVILPFNLQNLQASTEYYHWHGYRSQTICIQHMQVEPDGIETPVKNCLFG
jgi:hypothetical protein